MIVGFEDFTQDVKDSEIEIINLIARGLRERVGGHKAITNASMRALLYANKEIMVSDAKMRKYIQYIRAYNLVPMLCASRIGYWVASSPEEFIKYREGYVSRIRAMEFTKACMFHYEIKNNVTN